LVRLRVFFFNRATDEYLMSPLIGLTPEAKIQTTFSQSGSYPDSLLVYVRYGFERQVVREWTPKEPVSLTLTRKFNFLKSLTIPVMEDGIPGDLDQYYCFPKTDGIGGFLLITSSTVSFHLRNGTAYYVEVPSNFSYPLIEHCIYCEMVQDPRKELRNSYFFFCNQVLWPVQSTDYMTNILMFFDSCAIGSYLGRKDVIKGVPMFTYNDSKDLMSLPMDGIVFYPKLVKGLSRKVFYTKFCFTIDYFVSHNCRSSVDLIDKFKKDFFVDGIEINVDLSGKDKLLPGIHEFAVYVDSNGTYNIDLLRYRPDKCTVTDSFWFKPRKDFLHLPHLTVFFDYEGFRKLSRITDNYDCFSALANYDARCDSIELFLTTMKNIMLRSIPSTVAGFPGICHTINGFEFNRHVQEYTGNFELASVFLVYLMDYISKQPTKTGNISVIHTRRPKDNAFTTVFVYMV